MFERRHQLLVVFDFVLRLQVVEDLLVLFVADLVPQLFAALNNQHLVDNAHQQDWCHFCDGLAQLFVALRCRQIDLLLALPNFLNLSRFKVAFGEDLSVHLDEHLLQDF